MSFPTLETWPPPQRPQQTLRPRDRGTLHCGLLEGNEPHVPMRFRPALAPHVRRAGGVSSTSVTRLAEWWGLRSHPPSHPRALQCHERLPPLLPPRVLTRVSHESLPRLEEVDLT